MQTYLLPNPTALEGEVAYRISGQKRELATWKTFPSGEIWVQVKEGGEKVCVIGRTHPPAENLISTLLLLDTLRRRGVKDITLVLPYFAYGRQDRQKAPGETLSADCITSLLAFAGAFRMVTVDIHSPRIFHKSPIPIVDLTLIPEMALYLRRELKEREYTVVAVDRGGQKRAKLFAKALCQKSSIAWIQKERDSQGKVKARRLHGTPRGRIALLVDDILDTGRTIEEATWLLRKEGFRTFFLCITHAIFSSHAVECVRSLKFEKILISDTHPISQSVKRIRHLSVVSAGKLLAQTLLFKTY